jgi:hypothetical protein
MSKFFIKAGGVSILDSPPVVDEDVLHSLLVADAFTGEDGDRFDEN